MLFIQIILKFFVSILLLVLLLRIGICVSPLGPSIFALELLELPCAKVWLLCLFILPVLLLHLPFQLSMILLHRVQLLFVSILHLLQRGIVYPPKFIFFVFLLLLEGSEIGIVSSFQSSLGSIVVSLQLIQGSFVFLLLRLLGSLVVLLQCLHSSLIICCELCYLIYVTAVMLLEVLVH